MDKIEDLYLTLPQERARWEAFLVGLGLRVTRAEAELDATVAILGDDGEILATGSVAGNVLKFVAVCTKGEGAAGARFNAIVTELSSRLAQRGVTHLFVATKPVYAAAFGHLGFRELAATDVGVLMEKGRPDLSDFLRETQALLGLSRGERAVAAATETARDAGNGVTAVTDATANLPRHGGSETLAVEAATEGLPHDGSAGNTPSSGALATTAASRDSLATIVMNANPFTLGHLALARQAAAENARLLVFVVSSERSLFTSAERLSLVRQGLASLDNVTVAPGGDYLVSFATFPAYFVASQADVIAYQTTLDARLFANKIAPALGITRRYLGSEPYSRTTAAYNDALVRELTGRLEVKVVARQTASDGQIISATAVRAAIATGNLPAIRARVPDSTYQFIEKNLQMLQVRIKNGGKINGN